MSAEKSESNKKTETDLGDELKVYELGFHVFPFVAEERLPAEMASLKELVQKNQGFLIGEESSPKATKLAYKISKKIQNKKVDFDTAYFGWIKFEASPESVIKIENELKNAPNILRFLLIKSVRESGMIVSKPIHRVEAEVRSPKNEKEIKEAGEISEVEVDKAIDELVVE